MRPFRRRRRRNLFAGGTIPLLLLVLCASSRLLPLASPAVLAAVEQAAADEKSCAADDDGTRSSSSSDGGGGGKSAGVGGENNDDNDNNNPLEAFASWFDQGVKTIGDFLNEEVFSDGDDDDDDDDAEKQKQREEEEGKKSERGDGGEKPPKTSTGMYDRIKRAFEGTFDDDEEGRNNNKGSSGGNNLFDLAEWFVASTFLKDDDDDDSREEKVSNLIERARRFAADGEGGAADETRSMTQLYDLFSSSFSTVKVALDRHFGHIDMGKFSLVNLMYYLEREDEAKNPSWKRRNHRFFKAVDPNDAYELHDALWLAEISYADTVEQLEECLSSTKDKYELVYSKMESVPHEPAHYIAIKRRQKKWSNSLEVLLSIRGTKELGDLLSDALLDASDYRGGKAHAGIMKSGMHIADKHSGLLRTLLDASGKRRIRLVVVGHSLGAGAATIAAMEFNNDLDFVDATVVGFGCPSLLSPDLADSVKGYVLTVVSDSDAVPRMSAATVGNVVLDIMGYDWIDRALRDVRQLIDVVSENTPFDFPKKNEASVVEFVNSTLNAMVRPFLKEIPTERLSPVLIPPGRCVHFFRDGKSFSGRHTPCSFFDSIDISWTMIEDHLTDLGYHRALLNFIRSHRDDMNFRFRHEPIF